LLIGTQAKTIIFIIFFIDLCNSIVLEDFEYQYTNKIVKNDNKIVKHDSQIDIPCPYSWYNLDSTKLDYYNLNVNFDKKESTWIPTVIPHEYINIVQFENSEYISVYFEGMIDYIKRYNNIYICTYTCTLQLIECHEKDKYSLIKKIFSYLKYYFTQHYIKIERNNKIITDYSAQVMSQIHNAYINLSFEDKKTFIKFYSEKMTQYIADNSDCIIRNLKPAIKDILKLIKTAARARIG
jgi:hypothetical protein